MSGPDLTVWFAGVVRVSASEREAADGDLKRAVQGALSRARVTEVSDARPDPARGGGAR